MAIELTRTTEIARNIGKTVIHYKAVQHNHGVALSSDVVRVTITGNGRNLSVDIWRPTGWVNVVDFDSATLSQTNTEPLSVRAARFALDTLGV